MRVIYFSEANLKGTLKNRRDDHSEHPIFSLNSLGVFFTKESEAKKETQDDSGAGSHGTDKHKKDVNSFSVFATTLGIVLLCTR
jgi:hypothetical protein